MVFYYLSEGQKLLTLDSPAEGCWVSMIHPTEEEIKFISTHYSIDDNDLRSALDTDERSRIAQEDNYVMVLVNNINTNIIAAIGISCFINIISSKQSIKSAKLIK